MSAIDNLLRLSREYGRAVGVDLTTVSWRLFGDSKKLGAILDGADIQVRRLERAVRWLSGNWPSEAVWPDEIARPANDDDLAPTHGGNMPHQVGPVSFQRTSKMNGAADDQGA